MSRSKRKKTTSIETPHISVYTINGRRRNDTFPRVHTTLMLSEAYRSLTYRQQKLVSIAFDQLYGVAKPKEVYRDCGYTDDCIFLTHCEAKKYGDYLKDEKGFKKDKKVLVERGILDLVTQGKYGKMSVYKFSSRWIEQEGAFALHYNEETGEWTYHDAH